MNLYSSTGVHQYSLRRWAENTPYLPSRGFSPKSSDLDFFCWSYDPARQEALIVKLVDKDPIRITVSNATEGMATKSELFSAITSALENGDVALAHRLQSGFDAGGLFPAIYLAGLFRCERAIEPLKTIHEKLISSDFAPSIVVQPTFKGPYSGLLWSPLRLVLKLSLENLGVLTNSPTALISSGNGRHFFANQKSVDHLKPDAIIDLIEKDEAACVLKLGAPVFATESKWWYTSNSQPVVVQFDKDNRVENVVFMSRRTPISQIGLELFVSKIY